MKLRKPCEHGLYDWHTTVVYGADRICPGGVFLPDDTLDLLEAAWAVIANAYGGDWMAANAEWQEAAIRWRDRYHAVLDALSVREAEPEVDKNQIGMW